MRLLLQTIFLGVSPSSCKHFFFLLAFNLFQYLQPLQTVYFKIFNPPPPPAKKIMVHPLEMLRDFSGRIMRGFTKAFFDPNLQNVRPPAFPKKQKKSKSWAGKLLIAFIALPLKGFPITRLVVPRSRSSTSNNW